MKLVRLWLLLWLTCVAGAVSTPVFASQVVLVILSDNAAPYQAVLQALDSELLPPRFRVRAVSLAQLEAGAVQVQDTNLAVTLGIRAAESLDRLPTSLPVLAALVPRDWYVARGQALLAKRRDVSVLFIDQPLRRQLRLIRAALPQAKEVGVVVSQQRAWLLPELESAAHGFDLKLDIAVVGPELGLVGALDKILADSDVLLALPDPEIFNSATAQTVFLSAYRYRAPVVGYSAAMTRAGALISVYSTPAQIGRQAAGLAMRILVGKDKSLPPQYPEDYSIAENDYVARSLGVQLPAEEVVRKSLALEPDDD